MVLFRRLATAFLSMIWLMSVGLPGCAASLDERMAAYVGQHRNELINNWGPPTEESQLKKGGTRIVYVEGNPLIHPNQIVTPALSVCEKVFITDAQGIIKSYSYQNCQ